MATPKARLRAPLVLVASVLLLGLAGLAEALALVEADSGAVAVVLEVIVVVSAADSVVAAAAAAEEEAMVADQVLATSPTAMDLPTVLPPVLVVDGVGLAVASVVAAEAVSAMTDAAMAIEDQAVQITNPSEAEIDTVIVSAIAMVGMVAETTMAPASVGMKATTTTIRDSDGGTEQTVSSVYSYGFVKGYLPFYACSSNPL